MKQVQMVRVIDAETDAVEWEGPLAEWVEANGDFCDLDEEKESLLEGREVLIGGGAAPAFRVVPFTRSEVC